MKLNINNSLGLKFNRFLDNNLLIECYYDNGIRYLIFSDLKYNTLMVLNK